MDGVYCLGDVVGMGREDNEVMDLLREGGDIERICGKDDEWVVGLIHGDVYAGS